MSSQASQQSPLDQAKAEVNGIYQNFQHHLDSLRTTPINKYGDLIDDIQASIKLSQDKSIPALEKAIETSNLRMDDLENSSRAIQERLEAAMERTASLEEQVTAISAERDDAKANYDKMKSDNDKAKCELKRLSSGPAQAAVKLEKLQQCVADIQKEVELVKQHSIDLQKTFAAVQNDCHDLSNEPTVEREHEDKCQQRASSMEGKPNASQLDLDHINKSMADDVPSPTGLSPSSQPTSTSAASIPPQDGSKKMTDGVGMASDQQHPHGTVPQPGDSEGMGEADRLFCRKVLDFVNIHMIFQDDIQFFFDSSGVSQPMNLTVMDEKLKKGAYTSVNSFREDFELMISLYKNRFPPHSMIHTASEDLKRAFEKTWSGLQTAGSRDQRGATQDRTSDVSISRGHKRKASTERPVASKDIEKPRPAPIPSHLSIGRPQPTSPAAGDSVDPALPQSEQPHLSSGRLAETGSEVWRGRVSSTSISGLTPFEFHVEANFVSVVKSPNTFNGSWTDLMPSELYVQARRTTHAVDESIDEMHFDLRSDIIILRLAPSSESEKREFRRLRRDLSARDRYGQVRHASVGRGKGGRVVSLHLVPQLHTGRYPDCLIGLDQRLLPPPESEKESEKALFLVVGFHVGKSEVEQLEKAWEQVLKALRTASHPKTIIDARDRIIHHTLPINRQNSRTLSLAKGYMTLLNDLPFAQSQSNLAQGYGHFLKLSYSKIDPAQPGEIGITRLPSRVFVLGGMMDGSKLSGLVVVDLQVADRPIWEICRGIDSNTSGDAMRLLRKKTPVTSGEWEYNSLISQELRLGSLMLADELGLKIERCSYSD